MIVQAVGVGAWLGGREVLRRVDLSVSSGECIAVVGANGAGKTTLLRVLATLLPCVGGTLRLFGEPAGRRGAAGARLGLIGHEPMLYAPLTVRENLELFARLHRVRQARERAAGAIDLVGLGAQADQRVGGLSRGLAQRAAIAGVLVHDPELVLADEPWTGLDGGAGDLFDRLLGRWRASGRTVVVSTHDLGQAARLATRVVGLRDGRVVLDAPAGELTVAEIGRAIGRCEAGA